MSKKGIADPDRGWRLWHEDEIFDPDYPESSGRYVPNTDDLVISYDEGWQRVIDVDYDTGKTTLDPIQIPEHTGADEDTVGYELNASHWLYLDTESMPYKIAFHSWLHFYGSENDHLELILGSDIENGEVISRNYDKDGKLIDKKVPLEEHVWSDGTETSTIKVPKTAHCSRDLDNGERVTGVLYNDQGMVTATISLLVKNTSWIRSSSSPTKYVTGIELETNFVSPTDERVVDLPMNFPLDSVMMEGVVHYDDGSSKRMAVDGTKFALLGLNNFIATTLGYRQPVTLVYYLSSDEEAYESLEGEGRHIAKRYYFQTTQIEGAYAVKLYTYPVWQNSDDGYKLEHYLYTLNRNEVYKVTSDVEHASSSEDTFDGTAYGVNQELTFEINLQDVSDHYHRSYKHLQSLIIRLVSQGKEAEEPNWLIDWHSEDYEFDQEVDVSSKTGRSSDDFRLSSRKSRDRYPLAKTGDSGEDYIGNDSVFVKPFDKDDPSDFDYGEYAYAKASKNSDGNYDLTIDADASDEDEWLERLYYAVKPLYNPEIESEPPKPTHFRLKIGNYAINYDLDKWDSTLKIPKSISTGDTVFIFWRRYVGDTDLELAVSAMNIHRTDS